MASLGILRQAFLCLWAPSANDVTFTYLLARWNEILTTILTGIEINNETLPKKKKTATVHKHNCKGHFGNVTDKNTLLKQKAYLQKYPNITTGYAVKNMWSSSALLCPLQDRGISQRSQNMSVLCQVNFCHTHEFPDLVTPSNHSATLDKVFSCALMNMHIPWN